MKNILILLLGLGIGAGGYWFLSHRSSAEAKEEAPAHAEEVHGEGKLKVSKEQQAAAGIKVIALEAARLPAQSKGYGRVLDPSSIITLNLDVEAARAALDASSKDYERVKALYSQNQNASARAFETADAVLKRDRALFSLAQSKLHAALGPELTQKENLPQMLESVAQLKWTLIRVDLLRTIPENIPSKFRVASLADEKHSFDAELLGPAPLADASLQGRGFLGLIKTNALAPNIAVAAWFDNPAEMKEGFLLPSGAVLQEGSEVFVFIQTGEDTFAKIEVELDDHQIDQRFFVISGLSATNRVVVEGAHQILSITKAEPAE